MDEPPSSSLLQYISGGNLLYILITVVLLLLAGFVSACEAALFSLKPEEIENLRRANNKNRKFVSELLSSPRLLLSALTAWKYAMLIGGAVIFTIAINVTEDISLTGEVLVLTICFALFSVITPKIYGSAKSAKMVKGISKIFATAIRITKPIVAPLLKMSNKVERTLELLAEKRSVEELTQAMELATVDNKATEEQKEILRGIVNFGTLTVSDVMRPENEINSVDVSLNFHDLLIYIKKSGFSRIPVYRDTLEIIEGVLYIKDLLPFLNEDKKFKWQQLIRPAYFVPESKKVDLLLKDFQEKRVHMALVLNDDGKVLGIITLEDIIEEIVGDIHDEFDEAGSLYKKIDEKTFVFDSKITVSEFCRILDIDAKVFGNEEIEQETLGALLVEMQNDLPKIGDEIVIEPLTLIIEAIDHKRIKKIRVQRNEQPKD